MDLPLSELCDFEKVILLVCESILTYAVIKQYLPCAVVINVK